MCWSEEAGAPLAYNSAPCPLISIKPLRDRLNYAEFRYTTVFFRQQILFLLAWIYIESILFGNIFNEANNFIQ